MGRPIKQLYFGNSGGTSITLTAIVPGGTANATTDVIKQTGSRRYKVVTSDGTGVVSLVAAVPTAVGEASLVATDSAAGTYYVTKLTAHKALLTAGTGTQFTTGSVVPWTLGTAVVNYSVRIPNA